MKLLLILLAAVVVGPSATSQAAPEQLMDAIEKQVRLPEGAASLRRYARHYALSEDGKVIGVYLLRLPRAPRPKDWGCEEIILEGNEIGSRPIPCPPEPDSSQQVAAGERRWFDDRGKLPHVSDGGCGIVTVVFNAKMHRVEHAYCNGVA